jgi:uncharacterized protein (DUF433 family)
VSVTTLERPLYSVGEAARLLMIPTATLRRWLGGAIRAGVEYAPVIREERTRSDSVTWGEFVEAGLLRGYRERHVPLQKMRPFIEKMRARLGVPYPLAHFQPLIDRKSLVYDLQKESDLPPRLYLVQFEGGQMQFAPPVIEFLEKVEFDPEGVVRLWPLGRQAPVAIDPNLAFGIPQIRGIRTEVIAESLAAGESREEAAKTWGLKVADIDAASRWELSLKAA